MKKRLSEQWDSGIHALAGGRGDNRGLGSRLARTRGPGPPASRLHQACGGLCPIETLPLLVSARLRRWIAICSVSRRETRSTPRCVSVRPLSGTTMGALFYVNRYHEFGKTQVNQ
jgi:hypothetical protein